MSKNLIIVESPAKIKTIKKFLGNDYAVEASIGHVRDLPKKTLSVDEDNDFAPSYEIIPGKTKVIAALRKAAKEADIVYLAPDPDREGEAIAWHIAELLLKDCKKIKRITFNEITPRAIKEALANPREINQNLFYAQQTRRILDRLVGYKISPLLWSKIKRGLSAGRVQSVALRLLVENELARFAFEAKEFWSIKLKVEGETKCPFPLELWKIGGKIAHIPNKENADKIENLVRASKLSVQDISTKERKKQPSPPFITSTLQQAANIRLGFTAKRTMSTAQQLYEGVELGVRSTTALITYMRTDSVRLSPEAIEIGRAFILKNYGAEYCPKTPKIYGKKNNAQDAHEAIRPVDPSITPDQIRQYVTPEQFKIYSLIWTRFLASQMTSAIFLDTIVTVETGDVLWRIVGEQMLFAGCLAVHPDVNEDEKKIPTLPAMKAGESLNLLDIIKKQNFTQPPSRFSEASLVKKLEQMGIGRPSTYATIISTLVDRGYAEIKVKRFFPTELGMVVSDLLTKHFPNILNTTFTASMEENLDKIADGNANWVNILKHFGETFYPSLAQAQEEMKTVKAGLKTNIICPKCGKETIIRFGKNGHFLACSTYPDCDFSSNYIRDEHGVIELEEAKSKDNLPAVGECPKCGSALNIKNTRAGGQFIACSAYPKCKYAESMKTGVKCPRDGCDGDLVERSSKSGKLFYSCSKYPKCNYAIWDFPVDEPCEMCDSKILVKKDNKTRGEHLACPQKTCKFWKKLDQTELSK